MAPVNELGWRVCSNCKCLVFMALCPASSDEHNFSTGNYSLRINNGTGQNSWRKCQKCQVLSWVDPKTLATGPCPLGKNHVVGTSGDYVLTLDKDETAGEHRWRLCKKCNSLALNANGTQLGKCKMGKGHDFTGSGKYTITVDTNGAAGNEDKWRHCIDCHQLVYDGMTTCSGGRHNFEHNTNYFVCQDPEVVTQPGDLQSGTSPMPGFQRCVNCKCLGLKNPTGPSPCASGNEKHDCIDTPAYILPRTENDFSDSDWRVCNKCSIVYYSKIVHYGDEESGDGEGIACLQGGTHEEKRTFLFVDFIPYSLAG